MPVMPMALVPRAAVVFVVVTIALVLAVVFVGTIAVAVAAVVPVSAVVGTWMAPVVIVTDAERNEESSGTMTPRPTAPVVSIERGRG
jgi:hypothetical protein